MHVLGAEHLGNIQVLFGEVHPELAVVEATSRVQTEVVGAGARADAIHHAADRPTVVPVGVEIRYVVLRNHGVDPAQQGLAGGQPPSAALDLVLADEGPD